MRNIKEMDKRLDEREQEIERLKLIIATAIRIYEDCEETQDYSTCDLDMYICLRNVYKLQELKGDSSNE